MKHVISTTTAPGAVGPYSQAIEANGFVFVSGQLPLDPATGAFVPGGTSEQAEQSIKNLLAVLEAAGCKAEDDAGGRPAQGRAGRDRGHRGQAVKRENQKEKGETACFSLPFCARTRYNTQISI